MFGREETRGSVCPVSGRSCLLKVSAAVANCWRPTWRPGGGSGAGAAGRWSACLESVEPERRNSKGSEELERRSGPGQGPGFPSSSGELVLHSRAQTSSSGDRPQSSSHSPTHPWASSAAAQLGTGTGLMPRPEGRSQSTGLSFLGKIFPSRPISVFPNQGPATGHSWIILFGLTQCRATAMTTGSMVHRTSDALLCRCMTVQRTLHLLTLAFIIRIVGTLASTSQACLKAELENICNMANTQ